MKKLIVNIVIKRFIKHYFRLLPVYFRSLTEGASDGKLSNDLQSKRSGIKPV